MGGAIQSISKEADSLTRTEFFSLMEQVFALTAVASTAYRAGEKLHNLWDGETHDYTKKGGVIYKEIMLPDHAPKRFLDRYTLWNEVEQVEKRYDAQLSYSFDMALQNEFSMEKNVVLARGFIQKYFVSDGMIADFVVHQPDKEEGGIPNPRFHVLVPIRPLNADGAWGAKQHRVHHLDENENRKTGKRQVDLAERAEKRNGSGLID